MTDDDIDKQSRRTFSSTFYRLTPEEMWNNLKKDNTFGIDGYEVPRKYYDYYDYKERQRRLNALKKPPKHEWPPKDWKQKDANGDEIIKKPRRPHFLDDLFKWADSYSGLPKGGDNLSYKQEILDKVKDRMSKYQKTETQPRNLRREFLNNIENKKELKERLEGMIASEANQSHKQELVDKIKEQMEEDEKNKKTLTEKNKERYTKNNPQMSRCDRITVVADAEYCGEQVPFYHTFYGEDEDESERRKKPLCFPTIDKTSKFNRTTMWKFAKRPYRKRPHNLKENEDVEDENDPLKEAQERKKQVDDERRENIINAIYDKAKVENKDQGSYFHIKVPEAFEKVNQRGKVFIKFIKNFKETEEYKNMPHKEHVEEPAPNKYFQTPSVKDEKRMKYLKSNPDKRTEDDEEKFKRYVDRRRMDTKMFKPMKTSIY